MKKGLLCILFLVVIFSLCLLNIHVVVRKTSAIVDILHESENYALNDDREMAKKKLLEAQELWQKDKLYYYSVLRHSETEDIFSYFEISIGSINAGNLEDFICHCQELQAHLGLIQETEKFTLSNIF